MSFMAPTVSIDKVKVKQMLIYQMLKVRDNFRMNMYQHRRERLLALIDAEYGGERVRFCDRSGLSESRVAQLLSTTYRDGTAFTEKTARKIEAAVGLPPLYFDQGVIENQPQPQAQQPAVPRGFMRVEAVDVDDPRLTIIPKVRLRLTAGLSGFEVEPEPYDGGSTTVPTDWIERHGYYRDKLIAITVRGESMEPTFYEGDLVVINTADTEPVAGAVYAVNYEGEPSIKRLARDAGRWWLVSDNIDQRRYYRQTFQSDTSQIIGRVVRKETERF
jgi:phage repressor protein C with HTH and peptisase S24 domain